MKPIVNNETINELYKKAGFEKRPTRDEEYLLLEEYLEKKGLTNKVPNFLYRYQSVDRLIQILTEKRIFISTPAKMNDIFDFQPIFDFSITKEQSIDLLNELDNYNNDFFNESQTKKETIDFIISGSDNDTQLKMKEGFGKLFIHFFEQQKFASKILCFTENYFNQLLWAHYAQNFTGVCVQHYFGSMDNVSKMSVRKVEYIDETPSLNIYDRFLNPMKYLGQLTKSIIVKNTDWQYEKEWRLILADQFGTWLNKSFIPLQEDFISLIIFGVRTDFNKILEVAKLVIDLDIELFQCFVDETRSRKFVFGHIDKNELIKNYRIEVIKYYNGFENSN